MEKEEFLKERAELIADHLRLEREFIQDVREHFEDVMNGEAPVIWIQGQNCTGCTTTLMNSNHFRFADLMFGMLSLRYQPTMMNAEGRKATEQIEKAERDEPGKYLVILEGAIPTGSGERFCTFGTTGETKRLMGNTVPEDRTAFDWMVEVVPGAEAVLAIGNCASFGGLPMLISHVTGATAAADVVAAIDSTKPVINVAGCPPHPDWIIGTLIALLLWIDGHREAPVLDERGCMKWFYESKVHDSCERKPAFEAKQFLEDWNDCRPDEDRCLLKMGCKGPATRADCPVRLWDYGVDWCVGKNTPCQGCVNPDFLEKLPHPKEK